MRWGWDGGEVIYPCNDFITRDCLSKRLIKVDKRVFGFAACDACNICMYVYKYR